MSARPNDPPTPQTPSSQSGEPAQGDCPSVEGFEILDVLGRGGLTVVYRAFQMEHQREVALAVLHPTSAHSSEATQRFRQAMELQVQLRHPGLVPVYAVGEGACGPYLVMAVAAGGTLRRKLARLPQPPCEAISWVLALAKTVHYLHDNGIIHCDVKPANVLVAGDNTLWLCDFTLAMRVWEGEVQTQDAEASDSGLLPVLEEPVTWTGGIAGTPGYMAPEQAAGRRSKIGPATDVYGLGAVLYECLTGRPPFKAATPDETIRQVIANDPVPPSVLVSGVPGELETICLKCLHKQPEHRYASALDLADVLAREQR